MNHPHFDRGVLCLSFGGNLALIQLSSYENQVKIRRSKLAMHSSRIVYIAITHVCRTRTLKLELHRYRFLPIIRFPIFKCRYRFDIPIFASQCVPWFL